MGIMYEDKMARRTVEHIEYIQFGDKRFLPCPFCGEFKNDEGDSFDILFDFWYKVRCINCCCMPYSPNSNTIEKAIEFWNVRVQLASVDDAKFLIRKVIKDLNEVLK